MRIPIVRPILRPRPRPDRLFGAPSERGPGGVPPAHPRPGFEFPIRDGRLVFLSPVEVGDRPRLEAAFDLLSDRSRQYRFFRSSDRLSESELRYFTEVDQVDHVAWCALDTPDPPFDGLASGRMIRDRDDRRSAEVAVTVLDACQGLGLGTLLLGVLVLRARMLGIERLRAVALPENVVVRNWLSGLGWTIAREDALVEFALSTAPDPGPGTTLAARDRFDRLLGELRAPLRRCLSAGEGPGIDRPGGGPS
ncbi:hypothetical protein [Tautonia plasticadhaerens]|uniref:Acetyltransferase Pat n=1 Tax=Tautonia plasticadhaerens TaxID=2527974 RepID=A0A518H783_9BACT|nr:hypothetical protein [Tautonia plasticadhaerens]QDV36692.1 Acetyltransferase Pat [Tautonia plasticadhaerens]